MTKQPKFLIVINFFELFCAEDLLQLSGINPFSGYQEYKILFPILYFAEVAAN
jgi:hypothetical protein